jgi:ornithine cyclodeaminase/alanine dehydrogenase-like protein (mu-crystallin family)
VTVFHKGTLILEENDIIHLIKDKITIERFLKELFTTMESGFKKFAKRQIINPTRHEFYFKKGSVESISASDNDHFSCKIVNTHKENPLNYRLPTIIANGILVDGETGYPLMITGSTILTALRTGVASAIATKYLAKK